MVDTTLAMVYTMLAKIDTTLAKIEVNFLRKTDIQLARHVAL